MKQPKDLNAEACLLSAVINEPSFIIDLVTQIDDTYFFDTKHKIIYNSMKNLFLENKKIDIVVLSDDLVQSKKMSRNNSLTYLNDISDVVRSSYNSKEWIGIVKEKYLLRHLINKANEILTECTAVDANATNILEKAQKNILGITLDRSEPFKNMEKIADEMIDYKEKVYSGEIVVDRFYTGIGFIDHSMRIIRGNVVVIGAKSSVGKSAFASQIAFLNARSYGYKVGIFTMEMTSHELMEREVSRTSKLTLDAVITPKVDDFSVLINELEDIRHSNVLVDDNSVQSLSSVRAKAMQMKHTMNGLDLIVVDYYQLMKTNKADRRDLELAELTRGFKVMAKELDIAIIPLTQLNEKDQVRESKTIKQDADGLIIIDRPLFTDPDCDTVSINGRDVEVNSKQFTVGNIKKSRMGETKFDCMWFEGSHQRFENYTGQMEEQE